jgi:hypothetical protein
MSGIWIEDITKLNMRKNCDDKSFGFIDITQLSKL